MSSTVLTAIARHWTRNFLTSWVPNSALKTSPFMLKWAWRIGLPGLRPPRSKGIPHQDSTPPINLILKTMPMVSGIFISGEEFVYWRNQWFSPCSQWPNCPPVRMTASFRSEPEAPTANYDYKSAPYFRCLCIIILLLILVTQNVAVRLLMTKCHISPSLAFFP